MEEIVVMVALLYGAYAFFGDDKKPKEFGDGAAHVAEIQAQEAKRIAEARESAKRTDLRMCLDFADMAYWDYIKLNGRHVKGKPGQDIWRASQSTWNIAAANKANAIAACRAEAN